MLWNYDKNIDENIDDLTYNMTDSDLQKKPKLPALFGSLYCTEKAQFVTIQVILVFFFPSYIC